MGVSLSDDFGLDEPVVGIEREERGLITMWFADHCGGARKLPFSSVVPESRGARNSFLPDNRRLVKYRSNRRSSERGAWLAPGALIDDHAEKNGADDGENQAFLRSVAGKV